MIRNVSDTALWVAMYRARETERPSPLFHDPYARPLAGARGEEIVTKIEGGTRNEWAFVIRTFVFDEYIRERIAAGADLVVNLASGLDARPFRMELPPDLTWIDVDLPEILEYKKSVLAAEKPKCRHHYFAVDLSDAGARRKLFATLGSRGTNALIITEGLLIYLCDEDVRGLATDLAAVPSFRWWVLDIASPGLLRMMQKQFGQRLEQADAALRFAPAGGPWYFESLGWRVVDVKGSLKSAAKVMKLPLPLRLVSFLPENPRSSKGIWGGTCLLQQAVRPEA